LGEYQSPVKPVNIPSQPMIDAIMTGYNERSKSRIRSQNSKSLISVFEMTTKTFIHLDLFILHSHFLRAQKSSTKHIIFSEEKVKGKFISQDWIEIF